MKPLVAYYRVSTREQGKSGLGLDAQRAAVARLIWLEEVWINKLDAIRMPRESYSDVILWLAELEAAQRLP